jgi:hypothetical protein
MFAILSILLLLAIRFGLLLLGLHDRIGRGRRDCSLALVIRHEDANLAQRLELTDDRLRIIVAGRKLDRDLTTTNNTRQRERSDRLHGTAQHAPRPLQLLARTDIILSLEYGL